MGQGALDRAGNNSLHWFTRYSFLPLAFFTAVFGPLLVLQPRSTDDFWSWTIRPDLSAVWVGAGYTFGAVAISTMLVRGRWAEAIVPVVGTWPFSIVMLLATIVHNDRFFTDSANFYVWFAIYLYLPLALPVMFLLNRRADPGIRTDEKVLPVRLRWVLSAAGLGVGVYGLLLIVGVGTVVESWAWPLTPLMAKVVGGWLLFIATGALLTVVEVRYAAYRSYFPISAFWFALLLISSVANREDFEDGLSVAAYFLAVTAAALGSITIFFLMERSADTTLTASGEPSGVTR